MTRQGAYRWAGLWMAGTAVLGGCGVSWWRPAPSVDSAKACIDAQAVLRQAAEDPEAITRSNAIEALAQVEGDQAGGVFMQALRDPDPAVRFATAMAIGDVRYAPAKAELLRLAQYKQEGAERDKRIFCALVYALFRLGDTSFASELGSLLFDAEASVRSNAAMVMGKMGEPSAVGPLNSLLTDEKDAAVQLQAVEALAALGDQRSATLLEAYTKTPFEDERLVAIRAMAQAPPARATNVLWDLVADRQPPRVRVAAADALARLGQFDANLVRYCRQAATSPEAVLREAAPGEQAPSDVQARSLQQLAAISLGNMRDPSAVEILHPLLGHPHGGVRVAAAMSILKLLPGYRKAAAAKAASATRPKDKEGLDEEARRKAFQTRPKLERSGAKD